MMRRHALLGTTILTASTLLATTATADITGADVWNSYTSYYEATGAQVFGEQQADGDVLVIADPALLYRLPFNVATIRVSLPDMTLTNQSDGTVAIGFPDTFDMTIDVDVPDEGAGSGTITMSQTDYSGVASGTPEAVTFTQSATAMEMSLTNLDLPEEEIDVQMQVQSEGYDITSTVTQGDLITVSSDMTLGAADVAYVITGNGGDVISNTGQFGKSENVTEMALPAGGSDLFNLSRALQDGAFLRGSSVADGNSSETVTSVDGQIISEQSSTSGVTNARFAIDTSGVDLFVEAMDSTFKALIPDVFPAPIEGAISNVKMGYLFPLLPSEDAQDVGLQIGLTDLTISEALWGLFDPAGELPRDPATINIDLAGTVVSDIDWLNIATLEGQLDQPVPPIAPESVTINALEVSAIGASVNGSGAFTLDMADMQTIPGFPRPEGSALLEVSGANALLDRLTALGFIGPDEVGMARLGMGFVARSTGDDSFETEVEVNAEGHVLVNGQRMR